MQYLSDAAKKAQATTIGAAHAVADAAETAAHAATDQAERAVGAVDNLLPEEAKRIAHDNAIFMAEQAKVAAAQGKDWVHEQQAKFAEISQQFQLFMEMWLKQKMQQQIGKVVDTVPGIVKDAAEDPEMPRPVSRIKDRVIDTAWPDIKHEIMWKVAVALDADQDQEEGKGPGTDCIRAFLRYHIYPYDKSIWGKIKDPVWIIFTLASLIPWAGMTPLIFLFLFLIIDKTEEYQLIAFILQFKGTQFISHGVIRCITGFFMYLNCVTVPAKEDHHACDESGPGVAGPYEIILGGWGLQVALVWCAFLLIPCSKEKGKQKLKGSISMESVTKSGTRRGGYIRNFLIYDMFCFLLCAGMLAYVISTRPGMTYDEWVVKHAFYAVQVVYGFTAAPFFLFTLPVLQAALTHSVPTAYDRLGRATAIEGPPKPKPEPADWSEMLPLDEAQNLLNQMQAIAMGRMNAEQAFDGTKAKEKEKDVEKQA